MDYYKRKALPLTSLFFLRRYLFAFVIAFCGKSIVLQVALCDILSTTLLAFYFSIWPMMGFDYNAIYVINELVVLIAIWTMFHFTLYIDDAEVRYEFGWQFL